MSKKTSVTIIGAGFCGTMVVFNIINQLSPNHTISINWIEKSGQFGQGVAYSTEDPNHLLNVRAVNMGALSGKPEHFYQWIQSSERLWRPYFSDLAINSDSFVPRKIYALYLQSLIDEAKQIAIFKQIEWNFYTDEALAINPFPENRLQILLNTHEIIITDFVVLATNVPTYQSLKIEAGIPSGSYIENIWTSSTNSLSKLNVSQLDNKSKIAIIGTGLTMVDATVTLIDKGFEGEILAISTHGQLPAAHHEKKEALPPYELNKLSKRLIPLFKHIRKDSLESQLRGSDWRAVVDALRPITVPLWNSFSLKDKKIFLRHVLSIWNKYRHRIPPQSYKTLMTHLKNGKLTIIKGRVKEIHRSNNSSRLCLECDQTYEADIVINSSGPQIDIRKSENPLIKNLLEQGFIKPGPLNLGIAANEHFQVIGNRPLPIYALGQILLGQRLETVAVPELREQCHEVANEICKQILQGS